MKLRYREVPGFPGYRVGDDGSVWSALQKRTVHVDGKLKGTASFVSDVWKRIAPYHDKDGYLGVKLRRGGRATDWRIHVLVLTAFVGPRPVDCKQTRHLDGNCQNNDLGNLRWGTPQENYLDRVRHGTPVDNSGERHGMHKLTAASVVEMRLLAANGVSRAEIAARFGIASGSVGAIIRGDRWRHLLHG